MAGKVPRKHNVKPKITEAEKRANAIPVPKQAPGRCEVPYCTNPQIIKLQCGMLICYDCYGTYKSSGEVPTLPPDQRVLTRDNEKYTDLREHTQTAYEKDARVIERATKSSRIRRAKEIKTYVDATNKGITHE
jgi:hypothetical protein